MTSYVNLPFTLRPDVRIAGVASGVDRSSYAAGLLGALYDHRSPAELTELLRQVLAKPALQLPRPDGVLDTLHADVASSLRERSTYLDSAARLHYPAPGETITASYATYVASAEDSVLKGTVVWVRETDRATVQFVLRASTSACPAGPCTRTGRLRPGRSLPRAPPPRDRPPQT